MKLPLTQALLEYIREAKGDFNELALQVFAYQYEACKPYQRYCQQVGKTPGTLTSWKEVPAVSTEVFREFPLCALPTESARYVFQTSGTSQEVKGRHYYHDLSLYEAAVASSFMAGLGLNKQDKPLFRILTPSFLDVSTSSLYYMFQKITEWYGDKASRFYFRDNEMDCQQLAADLKDDSALNRPIVLLGTAFSFVNFWDYLNQQKISLKLPQGSRLLETGGLKGRTRSVSREELYQFFAKELGLALDHCFSEYGMTELSSQCYSKPNSHIFRSPPWMLVQIIGPESGKAVSVGETGLVQFFDLANYTAVSAVLTSDLAIKHEDGFELLGRAPKARLRGCSTAFEAREVDLAGKY